MGQESGAKLGGEFGLTSFSALYTQPRRRGVPRTSRVGVLQNSQLHVAAKLPQKYRICRIPSIHLPTNIALLSWLHRKAKTEKEIYLLRKGARRCPSSSWPRPRRCYSGDRPRPPEDQRTGPPRCKTRCTRGREAETPPAAYGRLGSTSRIWSSVRWT